METEQTLPLSDLATQAIDACGGAVPLSKTLNLTKGAVYQWKDSKVPSEHLWRVSSISGIPPERIRPDLFTIAQTQPLAADTTP